MCITIPMKVEEIKGLSARCSAMGAERTASLTFVMDDPPELGEYVMINRGHVVRKLPVEEAMEILRLCEELFEGQESSEGETSGP